MVRPVPGEKFLKTNAREGSGRPGERTKHPFCQQTSGGSVRSDGIPQDPEQLLSAGQGLDTVRED